MTPEQHRAADIIIRARELAAADGRDWRDCVIDRTGLAYIKAATLDLDMREQMTHDPAEGGPTDPNLPPVSDGAPNAAAVLEAFAGFTLTGTGARLLSEYTGETIEQVRDAAHRQGIATETTHPANLTGAPHPGLADDCDWCDIRPVDARDVSALKADPTLTDDEVVDVAFERLPATRAACGCLIIDGVVRHRRACPYAGRDLDAELRAALDEHRAIAASEVARAEVDYRAGDRTLSPADPSTEHMLPALAGDTEGRVVVRIGAFPLADEWQRVLDQRSGLWVEVRAADCGSTCRCAGEVRLTEQSLATADVDDTLEHLHTAAREGFGLSLDWQHVAALDEFLTALRGRMAGGR